MLDEEKLYEIKSKTVPFEQSIYGRSPLFRDIHQPPKEYTDIEAFQHKSIYKEAYEKAKAGDTRLSFMKDSLDVLKKIMEQEGKTVKNEETREREPGQEG
jgi:hypothetical protein